MSKVMDNKPQKIIGSVHAPFSFEFNPDYIQWCESRIAELDKEVK